MRMAARAGIGPVVGYAPEGSAAPRLVRQGVEAAAWHLNVEPQVLGSEDAYRSACVRAWVFHAMKAGWIVVTSRRHQNACHGQELFWAIAQRPEVLVRALLRVARLPGPKIAQIRRAARDLTQSLTLEDFLARWAPLLVSVVVPSFNDENDVLSSMQSVLSQTVADLELIVVDDGSTDGSRFRTLLIEDPRIRRVWQAGRGPSAARNAGLALVRAESYLAFLDSDDVWDPSFLERTIETIEVAPLNVGLATTSYQGSSKRIRLAAWRNSRRSGLGWDWFVSLSLLHYDIVNRLSDLFPGDSALATTLHRLRP